MRKNDISFNKREKVRKIAIRRPARLSCESHKYQAKKNKFKGRDKTK